MYIQPDNVQPATAKTLISQSFKKSKELFTTSLILTIPIFSIIFALMIYLYDFLAANEISISTIQDESLSGLSVFNGLLIVSVGAVIMFLLLVNNESERKNQVVFTLKKTVVLLPTVIAATIVYTTFVLIGFSLLLIPGLLLLAYLGFYTQAIVFERKGIFQSIFRSRDLVKGSFWKIFLLFVSVHLAISIIQVTVLTSALMFVDYTNYVEIFCLTLINAIITPFIGTLFNLFYLNLRSGQEAFDYETYEQENPY
ncbi:hypothetical protein J2S78_001294 [Salibacterium salarium]|uniref:hypothetical protein n=1 Tax=Salibacterium salarium TaxID=284579 RepID=UPI002782D892|nr:hypothetical protein [Salibacterium salarium]MDQ0298874.1 hypothetical protein [Salibacterium salarium]